MPHQCVRCNTFYEDGAREILNGCKCGGRLFFYVRKEKIESAQKKDDDLNLSPEDRMQIEDDVLNLIGKNKDNDETVVLDIENVRILAPGKYELDLVSIFKGEPIIFKLEEGKYVIDLQRSLKK